MNRHIVPLAAVALVGIALAAWSGASAKPVLAGTAGGTTGTSCFADAVGDAGDAPDVTFVTIRHVAAGLQIDVRLAGPTELGSYGWILVGLDTDRNPFTGGGRGDELLTFTNGDGTALTRWVDGRFTPNFPHRRFAASFSGTDLRLTFARADVRARSFDFSVASLREQADLAPGGGVAAYPGGPSGRCGDTSRAHVSALQGQVRSTHRGPPPRPERDLGAGAGHQRPREAPSAPSFRPRASRRDPVEEQVPAELLHQTEPVEVAQIWHALLGASLISLSPCVGEAHAGGVS